jgi:hypothetical protein
VFANDELRRERKRSLRNAAGARGLDYHMRLWRLLVTSIGPRARDSQESSTEGTVKQETENPNLLCDPYESGRIAGGGTSSKTYIAKSFRPGYQLVTWKTRTLTLPDERVMESAVTERHPEPRSERTFFWQRTSHKQLRSDQLGVRVSKPPKSDECSSADKRH